MFKENEEINAKRKLENEEYFQKIKEMQSKHFIEIQEMKNFYQKNMISNTFSNKKNENNSDLNQNFENEFLEDF